MTLLTPNIADACSPPLVPPVQLFGGNIAIPVNLIYFEVLRSDPGHLELRTESGELIPSSIRQMGRYRVFTPDELPAENTNLVLHYTMFDTPHTYHFQTQPAQNISFDKAQLELLEEGLSHRGDSELEASFARVRHHSPATSTIFHLLRYEALLDEHPIGFDTISNAVSIYSYCHPIDDSELGGRCGSRSSLAPGPHTLKVQTWIIGSEEHPAPVSLTVALPACDALKRALPEAETRSAGCSSTHLGAPNLLALMFSGLVCIRLRRRKNR